MSDRTNTTTSTSSPDVATRQECESNGDNPMPEKPPLKGDDTNATNRDGSIKFKDHRAYLQFEEEIVKLDAQLHKLSSKAREIGSSVGILSASTRLGDRLVNVLYHLNENAADLFPRNVKRGIKKLVRNRLSFDDKHRPVDFIESGVPDRRDVLLELQGFTQDISTLLECFSHFPQFRSVIPDPPSWVKLRDWAEYLENFQDAPNRQAVQVFLHESLVEITPQINTMSTQIIPSFIKFGIPTVRSAQDHSVSILDNLSTVATFFSGVTASMIQLTWGPSTTRLNTATNAFWLISLVFSTSAAVYSLLGLAWTQAIFRSPDHCVPWWVRMWMRRSPLVLLVLSMACFFVGLVLFTYTTREVDAISTITLVLSSLCCVGLVVLSLWFAFEQLTYSYYQGHRWLSEVLSEGRRAARHRFRASLALFHPREVWRRGKDEVPWIFRSTDTQDPEKSGFDVFVIHGRAVPQDLKTTFWSAEHKSKKYNKRKRVLHRWQEAYRRICEATSRAREHEPAPNTSQHSRQDISGVNNMLHDNIKQRILHKLERMGISQELLKEDSNLALVHVVKFSPDGKSLLVSRFDRKAFIFSAMPSNETTLNTTGYAFDHPNKPALARRMQWGPDGRSILLSSGKYLAMMTIPVDGKTDYPFNQALSTSGHNEVIIRATAWAGSDTILSLIEQELAQHLVFKNAHNHNLNTEQHRFDDLLARDMVVTKDSKWMICIGSPQYELPANAKACNIVKRVISYFRGPENRTTRNPPSAEQAGPRRFQLAVYSVEKRRIVLRAPIIREMCDITLASNGDEHAALLSFEDQSPPQLWQIDIKNGTPTKVSMRHTYTTKTAVEFARLPCIFGGPRQEIILRAASNDAIHTWDRATAEHLRRIETPSGMGRITALAWNHGASDWMFATGTHDGKVQVWTVRDDPQTEGADNETIAEVSGQTGFPIPLRTILNTGNQA